MTRLTDDAARILQNITINDRFVHLNAGQLPRPLYDEVDTFLRRLGGHWKGNRRAHLFEIEPNLIIADALAQGELPPINPLDFFPTPLEVAAHVVRYGGFDQLGDTAELLKGVYILETSAGYGALADAVCRKYPHLKDCFYLVEPNEAACRVLRAKGYRNVIQGGFFDVEFDVRFARVIQNPPFNLDGDRFTYQRFIRRGFELLTRAGRQVAIAPAIFCERADKRNEDFLTFVTEHGDFDFNAPAAFKETGTSTKTVIIEMEQMLESERERLERTETEGCLNHYCFLVELERTGNDDFRERSQRIFERIKRGELRLNVLNEPEAAACAEIEKLYKDVVSFMRRRGSHVRMRAGWLDWLVRSFVAEEYAQFLAEDEYAAAA